MNKDTLLFDINQQGIATLTLNRPDVHNAFDGELIKQLLTALKQLNDNKDVRVVILAANGKSFCAGADVHWMQRMVSYSEEENQAQSLTLAELMYTLRHLQKPTIALVQGATYGGGVGLVACCDIAIASVKASFCFSEVKVGVIPAVISPYVIEAIGERAAKRYFLTAERFSAEQAEQLGLVHRVVDPDELNKKAEALVQRMLQNSPKAMCEAKRLITDVSKKPMDRELLTMTAKRIAAIRVSDEGQEGLRAFLQKRRPAWISDPD